MWKRSFRARLLQNLKVEDAKTKLSREASLTKWKLKMWKRSFRARLPSKSESGRCENDAFVQDFLQILKVQVVKVKLELSVPLRGWSENDPGLNKRVPKPSAGQDSPSIFWSTFCPAKRSISFIRQLSKTDFVRDFPPQVKVEDVKAKLSCETPSKSESGRCENEAFVRGVPHKVKVEDVKTKLSCKTSFKICKWNMWERSFRARLPSKRESWRCENEAFVRDFPQKVKVEDVEAKLSCRLLFKIDSFNSIHFNSIQFNSSQFNSIQFN